MLSRLLLTLHYIFFSITQHNIGRAKPNSEHIRFTTNDVTAYGTNLNCYKNLFYIYIISIILYEICTNKPQNKTCYKNDKALTTKYIKRKMKLFP